MQSDPVLTVSDLVVEFASADPPVTVLHRVNFSVGDGELLGIVGETGSGKSLTLLSIMGLLPASGRIIGGSILYRNRELIGLDHPAYRHLRGREIGIVVQNAKSALNPLERIGRQIRAVYEANTSLRGRELDDHMRAILREVGFRDVDHVLRSYPHQLSGGMAQRVLIAIAIGSSPRLVLVDEPTSGLDPTVAFRVMETLRSSIRRSGAAGVVVTHNLGVIAHFCDRVLVMNAGRIVDEAPVDTFFTGSGSTHRTNLIEAQSLVGFDVTGNADTVRQAPEEARH